jgi:hypothetical protein
MLLKRPAAAQIVVCRESRPGDYTPEGGILGNTSCSGRSPPLGSNVVLYGAVEVETTPISGVATHPCFTKSTGSSEIAERTTSTIGKSPCSLSSSLSPVSLKNFGCEGGNQGGLGRSPPAGPANNGTQHRLSTNESCENRRIPSMAHRPIRQRSLRLLAPLGVAVPTVGPEGFVHSVVA